MVSVDVEHHVYLLTYLGPSNILFAGVYVCTFQLGNVEGWVSEEVKHAYSLDPAKWDWADYASRHSAQTTELERLSSVAGTH